MPRGFCTACYPEFAGPGERPLAAPPRPPAPPLAPGAPPAAPPAPGPVEGALPAPGRNPWLVPGVVLLSLAVVGAGIGTWFLLAPAAGEDVPQTFHVQVRDLGKEVEVTEDGRGFAGFRNWSAGDTVYLEGKVLKTTRSGPDLQVNLDGMQILLKGAAYEGYSLGDRLILRLTIDHRDVRYYDVEGHEHTRSMEWFKEDLATQPPQQNPIFPKEVVTRA